MEIRNPFGGGYAPLQTAYIVDSSYVIPHADDIKE